jgi:hypothetical protein
VEIRPSEEKKVEKKSGARRGIEQKLTAVGYNLKYIILKNPFCASKRTLHYYKDQLVNVVQGNNPCLQGE